MDAEHEFFVFLLENYASDKNRPTGDVLREWVEKGVAQEIFDGYFIYHQEALTNAYRDIDSLLAIGRHAY